MRIAILLILGILLIPLRIGIEQKVLKSTAKLKSLSRALRCRVGTIVNLIAGFFYLSLMSVGYVGYTAWGKSSFFYDIFGSVIVIAIGFMLIALGRIIYVQNVQHKTQRLLSAEGTCCTRRTIK